MERTEALGMRRPVCDINRFMSGRLGFEIVYYPECRGVWLDRGEIFKIIEKAVAAAQPAPQPTSFLSPARITGDPWASPPVSPTPV